MYYLIENYNKPDVLTDSTVIEAENLDKAIEINLDENIEPIVVDASVQKDFNLDIEAPCTVLKTKTFASIDFCDYYVEVSKIDVEHANKVYYELSNNISTIEMLQLINGEYSKELKGIKNA